MKNRRRPPKKILEDDLNSKAVLLILFDNKNLKNKWFWHQNQNKNGRRPQKKIKKYEKQPKFFLEELEWWTT